jgi:hypothetical protein
MAKEKVQVVMGQVTPEPAKAAMHAKMAKPGSGKKQKAH